MRNLNRELIIENYQLHDTSWSTLSKIEAKNMSSLTQKCQKYQKKEWEKEKCYENNKVKV